VNDAQRLAHRLADRGFGTSEAAALLAGVTQRWPLVKVDPDALGEFLAGRLAEGNGVSELHLEDLALTWACLAGDAAAHSSFVKTMRPALRRVLHRAGSDADELEAAVLARMLGDAGSPPTLGRYGGHGPLKHFVMVAAMRTLIDWQRARKAHAAIDDPWLELAIQVASDERGPRERSDWSQLRPHLSAALEGAVASLPLRQRNVLRLHYLEGVSADALGRMFGVHRATTTRWLADARAHVFAHVQRHLRAQLEVGASTLEAINHDLAEGIELSLPGFLAREPR
jgi:RNA polymerase sigma-70 factor (ECF subfamily)